MKIAELLAEAAEPKFDLAKHTDENGKYKSDFKPARVSLGKMNAAVYAVAIEHLTAPANVKTRAKELARDTDEFWNETIEQVARAIDQQKSIDEVLGEMRDAVDQVGDTLVGYFTNPRNFAPGDLDNIKNHYDLGRLADKDDDSKEAKALRAKLAKRTVNTKVEWKGDVPTEKLEHALMQATPNYAELKNIDTWERESEGASREKSANDHFTPERLQFATDAFDAAFDKVFSEKRLRLIARKPQAYDFPADFKPKTVDDLVKAIMKQFGGKTGVVDFAFGMGEIKSKKFDVMKVYHSKAAMAYIAKHSKRLG